MKTLKMSGNVENGVKKQGNKTKEGKKWGEKYSDNDVGLIKNGNPVVITPKFDYRSCKPQSLL